MNSRTLRTHLMKITPSEQSYLEGKSNLLFFRSHLHRYKDEEQREVLFFEFSRLLPDEKEYSFYVKKHSRFQNFPFHYHDYVELNYMYNGSCRQIINHTTYTLTRGQVLLMDSNTIHTIEPLGEEDILINIMIPKEYLNSHFFTHFSSDSILLQFFFNAITDGIEHDRFILFHSENEQRLHIFFNELLCEWYNPSIVHKDILENLFSLVISELVIVYKNNYGDSDAQNSKIIPMLRYIEQHYKTCTLEEMSGFFALSPNYLSSLLKKHTGSSFKELVLRQRLQVSATLLLNSQLSITEVSQRVGFQNITFFYKKFYEKYNATPACYREKQTDS